MGALGFAQIAALPKPVSGSADVQSAETGVKGDALGPNRGHELVPRCAECGRVELETEFVVCGLWIGHGVGERPQAWHIGDETEQPADVHSTTGVAFVEFRELR